MWCTFDYFEFEMSEEQARFCGLSGDSTEAVKSIWKEINLDSISDEDLKKELRQYGAWSDEELQNRQENEMRIIWIGACNSLEEIAEEGEKI